MVIEDGGPAFPDGDGYYLGMTIRDWFAGMALQGLFANPNVDVNKCPAEAIRNSFRAADAMITHRQKGKDSNADSDT